MKGVNITDVPLPNEESNFPIGEPKEKSPDSRGLAITYDLSWPGGGLLRESVDSPNSSNSSNSPTFCAVYPYTISYMPNVTNLWPEDNIDSPDCAIILGQDCVDAIIQMATPNSQLNCEIARTWVGIPECWSTFGYAYHKGNHQLRGWYSTVSTRLMTTVSGESFSSISYIYDEEENGDVYETGVNML